MPVNVGAARATEARECTGCKRPLAPEHFRMRAWGLPDSRCLDCEREYHRRYHQTHKAARNAENREWHRRNKGRRRTPENQKTKDRKKAWAAENRERLCKRRRERIAGSPEIQRRRAEINRRCVLRKLYGITPERYQLMLAEQEGRCAICRIEPGRRRLAVDHDHGTGQVRGLLCFGCNAMLERVDANRLSVLAYLQRYGRKDQTCP